MQVLLNFHLSEYYLDELISRGITDFDIVGMSYYWPWHQPHTIGNVANIISYPVS
jgi:arabinogalactan endo-1,4-beta-galactosidase